MNTVAPTACKSWANLLHHAESWRTVHVHDLFASDPFRSAFFAEAPRMNPHAKLITGVVCGVRVEDLTDPLMRKIRYLDKLVDELARGKAMTSILRR